MFVFLSKRYCSRLHEFEGSHSRLYQKYDEISTENRKLKEKVSKSLFGLDDDDKIDSRKCYRSGCISRLYNFIILVLIIVVIYDEIIRSTLYIDF